MPRSVVIVILLLAVVVGGAAVFLLRPPAAPVAPQSNWLSSLDPAAVIGLDIAGSQGGTVTLRPCEAVSGLWLLNADGRSWPVDAKRVRAAVRLLSDAAKRSPEPEAPELGGYVTGVTLHTGGEARTLKLADSMVGSSLVAIDSETPGRPLVFLASSQLHGVFAREGLLAWRDTAVFGGGTTDATRVRVEAAARRVMLAKAMGRWGVMEPIAAPAEPDAVAALLQSLNAVTVRSFTSGTDGALGLDRPVAAATLETDMRVPVAGQAQPRQVRLVQKLLLGAPADAESKTRFGSLEASLVDPATNAATPLWGPERFVVGAEQLDRVTADPLAYYSQRSVQSPRADVAKVVLAARDHLLEPEAAVDLRPLGSPGAEALRVRDAVVKRTLDGWEYAAKESGVRTLSPAQSEKLNAMLALLCEQAAERVSPDAPGDLKTIARLELHGPSGQLLDVLAIGAGKVGDKPGVALIVRSGRLYRAYFKGAAAIVEFLRSELPTEG